MNFEPAQWRLIRSQPAPGAWNMAVDEALLAGARAGESPPILRLYAWSPPCLSLGYGQPLGDVDLSRLGEKGWDLVRRPTGGKAILHTDELTYSVIGTRRDARLAGSILESYLVLAEALQAALLRLGLEARINSAALPAARGTSAGAVCFEEPSAYEITVNQRKLVGSAQARKGEAVLQHGTIPLTGDLGRITQALRFPDEESRQKAARRVLARATTVEREAGRAISWEETALAMEAAFSDVLNLQFRHTGLNAVEESRAEALAAAREAA